MNKRYWALLAITALIVPGFALADAKSDRHTERVEQHFAELDTDGDGRVTREEAASHRAAMFGRADTNGDGAVSEAEFIEVGRKRVEARQKKHFARLDKDGDGAVTPDEFGGRHDHFFDRMDADGDGVVTLDEAKAARQRHDKNDG
jgi:Ca2+-binding EF-hand superfamily protein